MDISFRLDILYENVKFYFKFIYPVEVHSTTLQIFSVFVEQRI